MGVRLVVGTVAGARDPQEAIYEFDQERIVIGRGASCDVRLPLRGVSDHHATLRLEHGRFVIVDEHSTNGTFVGEVRIVPGRPKTLKNGDAIRVANTVLTFHGGVAVVLATSVEKTAALARRMLREIVATQGTPIAPPQLVLESTDPARVIGLENDELLIGRESHCGLVLEDPDASREHAMVASTLEGWVVRDLGSKNGTFVGDRAVGSERKLRDGDVIRIGQQAIRFREPVDEALRALEGVPDERLPEVVAVTAEAEPSSVTHHEPPKPVPTTPIRARKPLGIDAIVYIVAGVILFLSLAAIGFLLR